MSEEKPKKHSIMLAAVGGNLKNFMKLDLSQASDHILNAAFKVAAANGHVAILRELHKLNKKIVDTHIGVEALTEAIIEGREEIANFILSEMANPGKVLDDSAGMTALMLAAKYDRAAVVDQLAVLKVDFFVTDKRGKNAREIAAAHNADQAKQQLVKYYHSKTVRQSSPSKKEKTSPQFDPAALLASLSLSQTPVQPQPSAKEKKLEQKDAGALQKANKLLERIRQLRAKTEQLVKKKCDYITANSYDENIAKSLQADAQLCLAEASQLEAELNKSSIRKDPRRKSRTRLQKIIKDCGSILGSLQDFHKLFSLMAPELLAATPTLPGAVDSDTEEEPEKESEVKNSSPPGHVSSSAGFIAQSLRSSAIKSAAEQKVAVTTERVESPQEDDFSIWCQMAMNNLQRACQNLQQLQIEFAPWQFVKITKKNKNAWEKISKSFSVAKNELRRLCVQYEKSLAAGQDGLTEMAQKLTHKIAIMRLIIAQRAERVDNGAGGWEYFWTKPGLSQEDLSPLLSAKKQFTARRTLDEKESAEPDAGKMTGFDWQALLRLLEALRDKKDAMLRIKNAILLHYLDYIRQGGGVLVETPEFKAKLQVLQKELLPLEAEARELCQAAAQLHTELLTRSNIHQVKLDGNPVLVVLRDSIDDMSGFMKEVVKLDCMGQMPHISWVEPSPNVATSRVGPLRSGVHHMVASFFPPPTLPRVQMLYPSAIYEELPESDNPFLSHLD